MHLSVEGTIYILDDNNSPRSQLRSEALNFKHLLYEYFCPRGRIKHFILYLCPKLFVIELLIHPRFLFANKVIRYDVIVFFSSVRGSISHPDLLVIHHPTTFSDHTGPQHLTFTF